MAAAETDDGRRFSKWASAISAMRTGVLNYQSPVQLLRVTTQLHWAGLEKLPPRFLERLSQEQLSKLGWSIGGAAMHETSLNLVLELLAADALPCEQDGAGNGAGGTQTSSQSRRISRELARDIMANLHHAIERPSGTSEQRHNSGSEGRLQLLFSSVLSPAHPAQAMDQATYRRRSSFWDTVHPGAGGQPQLCSSPTPTPSQVMSWLQAAGDLVGHAGTQVVLQEGRDVHLLELQASTHGYNSPSSPHGARSTELNSAPEVPASAVLNPSPLGGAGCAVSEWSQRPLSFDDPIPGLMNLQRQPRLVGVNPRCAASDGRTPLVLRVRGVHLQGGSMLVRHGGRYLSTRRMAEGRVYSGSRGTATSGDTASSQVHRGGTKSSKEGADEGGETQYTYMEVLVEDLPTCGLVTVECRQGLLLSNSVHLALVPAGSAMAREISSMAAQLNRPVPVGGRGLNRALTFQQQNSIEETKRPAGHRTSRIEEGEEEARSTPSLAGSHGGAGLVGETSGLVSVAVPVSATEQGGKLPPVSAAAAAPRSSRTSLHLPEGHAAGEAAAAAADAEASQAEEAEAAYDRVVRDLGSWIQFRQLLCDKGRQPSSTAAAAIAAVASAGSGASSTNAGAAGLTTRDSLSSKGGGPAPLSRTSIALRTVLATGNSFANCCTAKPGGSAPDHTAGIDLTDQLTPVLLSEANVGHMMEVGLQLLALSVDLGWATTARWVLQGLLEQRQSTPAAGQQGRGKGLSAAFREVAACVAATGLGLLHRAVTSRSVAMVGEVVSWYTAAGLPVDWGEQGLCGLTPLHLAACAKDGGLLSIHILRKWVLQVAPLWATARAGPSPGMTPADCARGLGQDFLNRMAAMADAVACKDCADLSNTAGGGGGACPLPQPRVAAAGGVPGHSKAAVSGMDPTRNMRRSSVGGTGPTEGNRADEEQEEAADSDAAYASAPTSRGPSPMRVRADEVGCLSIFGFLKR